MMGFVFKLGGGSHRGIGFDGGGFSKKIVGWEGAPTSPLWETPEMSNSSEKFIFISMLLHETKWRRGWGL